MVFSLISLYSLNCHCLLAEFDAQRFIYQFFAERKIVAFHWTGDESRFGLSVGCFMTHAHQTRVIHCMNERAALR